MAPMRDGAFKQITLRQITMYQWIPLTAVGMYNSLSLPNVYCTIKGVAVFIYSEEVKYCTCINHPVGDESSGLAFKG